MPNKHSSLLRDIQTAATSSSTPLSDLLRKCLILAKRLQHEPLARWVGQELNGYTSVEDLPSYRERWTEVRGTFLNLARQVSNVGIPSLSVDEADSDPLFHLRFMDGVAAYEALLRGSEERLHMPWPADYVAVYSQRLMPGYTLVEASRVVTRAMIDGMLDQIRSRVLAFALEIEGENPEAGDVDPGGPPPIPSQRVDQIFNTNIYGGTNVVATGSSNTLISIRQTPGDWGELADKLKEYGISEGAIDELRDAIDEDGGGVVGLATKGWLRSLSGQVANGSLLLANNITASGISTLILKYLGII